MEKYSFITDQDVEDFQQLLPKSVKLVYNRKTGYYDLHSTEFPEMVSQLIMKVGHTSYKYAMRDLMNSVNHIGRLEGIEMLSKRLK